MPWPWRCNGIAAMIYGFRYFNSGKQGEFLEDRINYKSALVRLFAGNKIFIKVFFMFIVNSLPVHSYCFRWMRKPAKLNFASFTNNCRNTVVFDVGSMEFAPVYSPLKPAS
jgi:hypothetical protein